MPTRAFAKHIQDAVVAQERSVRFLNRATWAVAGVVALGGIVVGLLPFVPAVQPLRKTGVINIGLALLFLTLVVLIMLLRGRLAQAISGGAADLRVLSEQNEVLGRRSEDLAQSNAALEESQQRQRKLIANLELLTRRLNEAQEVALIGYWEIDGTTGDVFWSDEMYRLCGTELGVVPPPTEHFLSLVHPDDRERMQEVAARALSELEGFTQQYRLAGPDGKMRDIQAHGRSIVDSQGNRQLVGTVQDVTARAQLEAQLRQSQKMDAVGRLAGGVAHDFNNILTVIEAYSGLLLDQSELVADDRESIEQIRGASRSAAALTRQLLAFSRQQILQPRVLDLNDTVRGMEKMLPRLIGEQIRVRAVLEPTLDRVKADPGQIEQILMNLAVNARDAMPNGGQLTIQTANAVLDGSYTQRGAIKTPGPHVMLAVTDTGSGIPEEILHRIFEPFFTTKDVGEGTGLGLSTVHGIVEQSGGHIWVYSEVGVGTTFKVYLPVTADAAPLEAREERRSAPDAPAGVATVLLVEDDVPVRRVTASILRRAGYAVIETSNGHDALEICNDRSRTIDLMISDMVMPGMRGVDLIARVHEVRPTLPALLMSGYTHDAVGRAFDLPPTTAFIEKPFTSEAIVGKVTQVVGNGSSSM